MENSLREICRENPLTKKFLIVPRLALGHQILEEISGEQPWMNTEVVTPLSLAKKIVEFELIREGKEILEQGEFEGQIEEIIRDLQNKGELKYFSVLQDRESLGPLVSPVIRELRMSGAQPENLAPGKFVDPVKGKEIKKIFQAFNSYLEKEKKVDEAEILIKATLVLEKRGVEPGLFLIPEDLEVLPLEKVFLENLGSDKTRRLKIEKLQGLERPKGFFYSEEKGPFRKGFSSLFSSSTEQVFLDTDIRPSYGAVNEVRVWLRELLEKEVPLESVQICYTRGEKYIPLIWNEARKLGLPITLGEGLPSAYTRPGRLLLNLIDWAEAGYPGPAFYRIIISGDLNFEKTSAQGRLFRKAAVGWGREWYLKALDNLSELITGDEKKEQLKVLMNLAKELFRAFPNPREKRTYELKLIAQKLQKLLSAISRISDPIDALALEAIDNCLERLQKSSSVELSTPEAYSRLRQSIRKLKVGAGRAEPGALHATHYRWGGWSSRPYTILVGMDSDLFPGKRREDPVLLDRERMEIKESLILRGNDQEKNKYILCRMLGSRKGYVGFSFERFDPGEGRNGFPAAFLLEVFRKKTGKPRADYSEFFGALPNLGAYSAGNGVTGLNGDEWWLKKVLLEGTRGNEEEVKAVFEGIRKGIEAEEYRKRTDLPLGKFEGKISLSQEDIPGYYSATRLETMATCPFKFFLESILRIQVPEEVEYDPLTWLDPLTRGSLLHDLYRDYVVTIPSQGMAWERLKEMGERFLEEKKENLPPPHEHVYLVERREIIQGLRVFWKMLKQQMEDFEPLYLEVPFGLGKEAVVESGGGLEDPIEINLESGKAISVCGRIDRIDRDRQKDAFRVWDYKTGGASRYSAHQVWAQGRQIQPALYARAAIEFLQKKLNIKDVNVERAGYLFPSERGEGQEVDWSFQQKELEEILGKMVDLIETGKFPVTPQKESCKFCDYPRICRSPESTLRLKAKLEEGAEEQLRPWKELSEYE